jgi:transketolase
MELLRERLMKTELFSVKRQISARQVRKIIIDQSNRVHIGHIGSALSIVDILVALYANVIKMDGPSSVERDRFILSNGHTALALYVVLFLIGIIDEEQLNSFCTDGSYLGVHPDSAIEGIDFSSGSLGQGLTYGVGAALAARLQHSPRRVFVLLSDAECNEGSVWEAVMFAAHHHLSNLVAIIDLNGQQAMGYTKDVLNLSPMAEKWKAFNWDVHCVDGNDIEQLSHVLNSLDTSKDQPHVLIANTTFGKGISFMENEIKWHYMPLSPEEYQQSLAELNQL